MPRETLESLKQQLQQAHDVVQNRDREIDALRSKVATLEQRIESALVILKGVRA